MDYICYNLTNIPFAPYIFPNCTFVKIPLGPLFLFLQYTLELNTVHVALNTTGQHTNLKWEPTTHSPSTWKDLVMEMSQKHMLYNT